MRKFFTASTLASIVGLVWRNRDKITRRKSGNDAGTDAKTAANVAPPAGNKQPQDMGAPAQEDADRSK